MAGGKLKKIELFDGLLNFFEKDLAPIFFPETQISTKFVIAPVIVKHWPLLFYANYYPVVFRLCKCPPKSIVRQPWQNYILEFLVHFFTLRFLNPGQLSVCHHTNIFARIFWALAGGKSRDAETYLWYTKFHLKNCWKFLSENAKKLLNFVTTPVILRLSATQLCVIYGPRFV